jgi:hypothetical protein
MVFNNHAVTIDDKHFDTSISSFGGNTESNQMPPTNRIWTLNDVAGGNNGAAATAVRGVDAATLPTSNAMAKLQLSASAVIFYLLTLIK